MLTRHPQAGIGAFFRRTIAAQTHFAALIASIVGTVVLIEKCLHHPPPHHMAATCIFGITSIFLFAVSSIYHFLYDGFQMSKALEAWFEKLDHIAIFLFISGTYSAVLVNAVSTHWANLLLVVIWSLASIGVLYTLFRDRLSGWAQHRYAYTTFYVIMGWVFAIRLGEILRTLSPDSIRYLMFGGISYSVGAVIYAIRWPNLFKRDFGFHELWHVCVVFGYAFHYLLIAGFY